MRVMEGPPAQASPAKGYHREGKEIIRRVVNDDDHDSQDGHHKRPQAESSGNQKRQKLS